MDVYVRTIISQHVTNIQRGETQHKIIDWNDSSDRKWLMTHLHWAMCNTKLVTIEPANGYNRTVTRQHLEYLARSN